MRGERRRKVPRQKNYMSGSGLSCRFRLIDRLRTLCLVLHDVEDGIKFCELHYVSDLIGEVEKFQFSPLVSHCREVQRSPRQVQSVR